MRKHRTEESHRRPRASSATRTRPGKAQSARLVFRPLTPCLMDALGTVLHGSWGTGCWCLYPRLTDAQMRELPGSLAPASGSRSLESVEKTGGVLIIVH